MAVIVNKRSMMVLYSGEMDPSSHRVRIVLAEKGVSYEVINVDKCNKPGDLFELNPYGSVPTLVDRDLVLYEPSIITEYLDERFPHPPLMPVYPVSRAKARLIIYRFDYELGPLVQKLNDQSAKTSDLNSASKELASYIVQLSPMFESSTYFIGDEFTLMDCCISPVLWRLSFWGVSLPKLAAKAVQRYIEHIFQRNAFQASLTDIEQEFQKSLVSQIV